MLIVAGLKSLQSEAQLDGDAAAGIGGSPAQRDDVLAERRSKLVAAEDEVRDLLELPRGRRPKMYLIAQCGPWLINLADDVASHGRQPAPEAIQPPAKFDGDRARRMLERPWQRRPEAEETVVPWLEQERTDAIEPLDPEDDSGTVSGLTEATA